MKTFKSLHAALIASTMLALLSCGRASNDPSKGPNQAQAAGTPAPPTPQVARVEARKFTRRIRLPGDLAAYQDVGIYAKVPGFVERVTVDRGSQVRRGQLLVQMSAPEMATRSEENAARARAARAQAIEAAARMQNLHAQRLEAEAKLSADEASYRRLRNAAATPGVVAGNELEIAQKLVEAGRAHVHALEESEKAAQAQIQAAEENDKAAGSGLKESQQLESYLRVTAPFDGVITERNVHEGSLIGAAGASSSAPLLRIQDIHRLRLVIYVPEAEIAGITQDARIDFTLPAFPGERFNGVVRRIAHALDVKTRTMPVELEVDNSAGRLSPGMYAEAAWHSGRPQPTLFVPQTAVAVTTERMFVIRVRNGMAEWVDVKRGAAVDNMVEVFGDLNPGDQVAVRGTDELRNGTKVNASVK